MSAPNRSNLIGRKFSRLEVLYDAGTSYSGHSLWICKCECGNRCTVTATNLKTGHTRSCGCLVVENNKSRSTHGMRGRRIYSIWHSMIQRCTNKKNIDYKNYGGRGIKVCESWRVFSNFFEDMGNAPIGKTIDRINNNGNYEKENCRWATLGQQANNKQNNHYVTYNGETHTLAEWSRINNLSIHTIESRITAKWNEEDLVKPARSKRKNTHASSN